MAQLFKNNAVSTLAVSIGTTETSITVNSGEGALFPNPSNGDYFLVTLEMSGVKEILKCSSRNADVLTVERAQEGTPASAFSIGTVVEMRITAETLTNLKAATNNELESHVTAANPHDQYLLKSSPNLTGVPTTPTPPDSSNGNQIANTVFTRSAVASGVAAHEALTDPHPQYIKGDSPALTGTPTTTSPASGDNSNRIATTKFSKDLVADEFSKHNNGADPHAQYAMRNNAVLGGTPTAATAAPDTSSLQLATTEFATEADKRRIHYTGNLDTYDANTPPDGWPDSAETWLETSSNKGWPSNYGRVVTYRGKALGADRARQMFYEGDGDRIFERRATDTTTWGSWKELWGDWNATLEAPISPSFLNSWSNVVGRPAAGFYKDKMGRAWTTGAIGNGTLNSAAFIVQDGYRPSTEQTLYTISNDAIGKVIVRPNGEVVPASPSSSAWVSLDNLSWRIGVCQNGAGKLDLITSLSGDFTATYTRSGKLSYSVNGIRVTLPDNEAPFQGGRRIKNIITASEDFTNAAWLTTIAGTGVVPVKTIAYSGITDPTGKNEALRLQLDRGTGTTSGDYSAFGQSISYSLARGVGGVYLRTTQPGVTANIVLRVGNTYTTISLDNTWTRFETTMDEALPLSSVAFGVRVNGTTQQTADILLWHPQVEDQSEKTTLKLSEYVSSDKDYGVGVLGVDYLDTNEAGELLTTVKGVLIRPTQVNSIISSQDYTSTAWTKSNFTVSTRFLRGPDRRTSWPKITEVDGTTAVHMFGENITSPANSWIRFTWKQKVEAGDRDTFRCQIYRDSSSMMTFDTNLTTVTGTVTVLTGNYSSGSSEIVADADGWYRITMWCFDSVGGVNTCRVAPMSGGSTSYVGDATKGLNVAEFDLEFSPTKPPVRDYLPSGTHAGGTLSVDTGGKLSSTELSITLYWEPLAASQGRVYLLSSEVDTSNGTYLLLDGTTLIFRKKIAGVDYNATKTLNYVAGTSYKIAAILNSSGSQVYVDDVAGTANLDNQPLVMKQSFDIGSLKGGEHCHGYIRLVDVQSSTCGTVTAPTAPTTPGETLAFNPSYPRIAGCNIGAKNYDDSAYQTALAKAHWVFLGFYYRWRTSYSYAAKDGKTYTGMRGAVKAIKDKNPDILIGQYVLLSDAPLDSDVTTTWGTAGQTYQALDYKPEKLDQMDVGGKPWWLYKINADGTKSKATWTTDYPTYDINITAFTQPDSNGDRYSQWLAKKDNSIFFSPVPEFDFVYFDNVFEKCRVASADFKVNGTNVSSDSVASEYRKGHADHWKQYHALQPKLYLLGNIDHDYSAPEFKNAEVPLNGGMFEGAIGASYSKTLDVAKARYHGQVANTAEPKLVMFNGKGTITDYKKMRLTLCLTLMDNGYCFYGPDYDSLPWFDEFDNVGAGKGYLGYPTEAAATTALTSTVYRRKFDNGAVFVNIGGSAVTVTLDRNYKRIAGTQDTTVNSGATHASGTTISIPANDGLILLNN